MASQNKNKKHFDSLKYVGVGGGEVYKKSITFYLAKFGNEHYKNIERIFSQIFATVMLSYDTKIYFCLL